MKVSDGIELFYVVLKKYQHGKLFLKTCGNREPHNKKFNH